MKLSKMVGQRTYLDYNASAPMKDSVREAVYQAQFLTGNPSSVHQEGRAARKAIEDARITLANQVGVKASQIIFTSGASEAATHALSPNIRASGKPIKLSHVYMSAIEHPCILAGGQFAANQISLIKVDSSGVLDLEDLADQLAIHDHSKGAPMVAVMLANNETGIIQPIQQISKLVHANNGFLLVDAVQALGKMPLDINALAAHFVIVSSHKIGGPKGAGALILGDASISPQPLIKGGGQENYQRSGTENVAAIAGFGAAIAELSTDLGQNKQIIAIRDSIEAGLTTICAEAGNKSGEPVFFSSQVNRLANTSCFAVPGIKAETALIFLDLAGIAVSSGSACSSGKVKKSHVLSAMGVEDDLAECALRVSAGALTTDQDAEKFLGAYKQIVSRVG